MIPAALDNRDCLVQADTASGKTLSYLLALLVKIISANANSTQRGDEKNEEKHEEELELKERKEHEDKRKEHEDKREEEEDKKEDANRESRDNTSKSSCLMGIIIAPTRELCIQIEETAKSLAKGLPLKTALLIGGMAMPTQVWLFVRYLLMCWLTLGIGIQVESKESTACNRNSG